MNHLKEHETHDCHPQIVVAVSKACRKNNSGWLITYLAQSHDTWISLGTATARTCLTCPRLSVFETAAWATVLHIERIAGVNNPPSKTDDGTRVPPARQHSGLLRTNLRFEIVQGQAAGPI